MYLKNQEKDANVSLKVPFRHPFLLCILKSPLTRVDNRWLTDNGEEERFLLNDAYSGGRALETLRYFDDLELWLCGGLPGTNVPSP